MLPCFYNAFVSNLVLWYAAMHRWTRTANDDEDEGWVWELDGLQRLRHNLKKLSIFYISTEGKEELHVMWIDK